MEPLTYTQNNALYYVLPDRLYSENGMWVQSHGCRLRIGLTDRLAANLRHLISVSLPAVGSNVHQGSLSIHFLCSHDALRFNSPLSGRVREMNQIAIERPDLLLHNPFSDGWLFEVDPFDWEEDKSQLLTPIEFYGHQTEDQF